MIKWLKKDWWKQHGIKVFMGSILLVSLPAGAYTTYHTINIFYRVSDLEDNVAFLLAENLRLNNALTQLEEAQKSVAAITPETSKQQVIKLNLPSLLKRSQENVQELIGAPDFCDDTRFAVEKAVVCVYRNNEGNEMVATFVDGVIAEFSILNVSPPFTMDIGREYGLTGKVYPTDKGIHWETDEYFASIGERDNKNLMVAIIAR